MTATIYTYKQHYTFSGKEKDAETGYHYFGARYYNSDLSLWLSVDPMSDKYPSLSPYNYCAWNPMKLADPTGKEIYYVEEGTRYVYKIGADGKYGFYDSKTGNQYSGNNKQFVNDLSNALGQLKEGKHGSLLVSYFEGSDEHDVYVSYGKENNQRGRNISWNNVEKSRIPVAFNVKDQVQSELTETFISLGHELAHAKDAYKYGDKFNSMSKERKEQMAMAIENLIRREHGMTQRSYYGLKKDGETVDFDSYPAIVFPTFSPVTKFFNY